jgi:hypothetical protein
MSVFMDTAGVFRCRLALVAAVLALASLTVELVLGVCSGWFFDPLPNHLAVFAYLSLALLLPFNEWALGRLHPRRDPERRDPQGRFRRRLDVRWRVGIALVATGAGLAVAVAYTVLFLPLLPVALFPLTWVGFGFCALSPAFCLAVLWLQAPVLLRRWRTLRIAPPRYILLASILAGMAALGVLVGRPVLAGYWAQVAIDGGSQRESAVGWLRTLRAEEEVLNLCYRDTAPPWTELGRFAATGDWGAPRVTESRKVYFLMTGRPFESADPSQIQGRGRWWSDFERDPVFEEQGGELVGRAVKGLSLQESRIDGVIDAGEETVYCEWTLVFHNAGAFDEEARAEILLPEGGVVDKASLWIDGEERPAAFGSRGAVRRAYEQVVVVQRRDPLLVTAKCPERVMAQCFPVPSRGEMKIRLGMSAPLIRQEAKPGQAAQLGFWPPGFQEVNFRLPPDLRTEVWLEGAWSDPRGLSGAGWELASDRATGKPAKRRHTARAVLQGREVFAPPPVFLAAGASSLGAAARTAPARPVDLLIVVDTAIGMEEAFDPTTLDRLEAAIGELPPGSHVRFVSTRDVPRDRKLGTEWLSAQGAADARRWWGRQAYVGGIEPGPALAAAWDEALGRPNPAAVVWLHPPIPSEFASVDPLVQRWARRPDGPLLIGVSLRPGPDSAMEKLAGEPSAYAVTSRPGMSAPAEAVRLAAAALQAAPEEPGVPLGGRHPAINGRYVDPTAALPVEAAGRTTAAHRLAVFSSVMAAWYRANGFPDRLKEPQKLAIGQRLVTPLSGAVVLETQEQYAAHNLSDSTAPGSIPSVPEPSTVALLSLAGALGAGKWLRRRRRDRSETSNSGEAP